MDAQQQRQVPAPQLSRPRPRGRTRRGLRQNRSRRVPRWSGVVFHHLHLGTWERYKVKHYMGVSKNRGTPKWMVKIMENPIKMDDLGVPLFSETPIYNFRTLFRVGIRRIRYSKTHSKNSRYSRHELRFFS